MRYAAILLSRQPLRPTGHTPWVKRAVEAARWLHGQGIGLVSSVGLQTWELLTALASDFRLPLLLVVPARSEKDFLGECDIAISEFDLDPERTGFYPAVTGDPARISDLALARDQTVVGRVNLLLPIAFRHGGTMEALLAEAEKSGRALDRRFSLSGPEHSTPLKYDLLGEKMNPALNQSDGKYLFHWTRSVSRPWPAEKKINFYRDIVQSDSWPRSAFDTLKRLVRMRRILASPRHMPEKIATVSFSGLAPGEVIPLMRWRARYREMTFEPYGIGIERRLAEQLGIREVHYYDNGMNLDLSGEDRWLWQSNGKKTDWRAEQEFRCLGDLDLRTVPVEALALFCRTREEANQLRALHSGPVWPLFS